MTFEERSRCWIATKHFANNITISGAGKTKQEAENYLWAQYNRIWN